ncbi:MAG: RDD family protein [Candidatus Dormibacteraeota bacterium]|nr:RDD family protein [Candidatus Dormibacteraeota bacterium]
MQPPDQSDDLVIATPERVAFEYEIAGIGSRFLAQLVDGLILFAIAVVILIGAIAIGVIFNSAQVAILFGLILGFILFAGYFLISEAAMSGQTLGKRAARLRVVGDRGQPITVGQAATRNLIRIVDFLPVFYGIGIITLFVNGRGKRLGDFAAGTLVVRDRQRISLHDLASAPSTPPAAADASPGAPAPPPSIWAQPGETPSVTAIGPSSGEAGGVDPALRRLVVAYAARREELPVARRQALADSAEPALRRALPELVATHGPLAALDQLAEREGVSPFRPIDRNARLAMALGVITAVLFFVPLLPIATGILSILLGRRALREIRKAPDRVQGEERAKSGRLLGIIGLTITSMLHLLALLAFLFRTP